MKLKDKIVLITASTRGIGLACVKACAKEGATVYMAARNLDLAKAEADKLISQGCNVKYVYNDASKPESYKTMTEDVIKDAGRIDVLINNFGTSNPGKDLDFSNTDTKKPLNIWQSKAEVALLTFLQSEDLCLIFHRLHTEQARPQSTILLN